jgi:hypothetical protein
MIKMSKNLCLDIINKDSIKEEKFQIKEKEEMLHVNKPIYDVY